MFDFNLTMGAHRVQWRLALAGVLMTGGCFSEVPSSTGSTEDTEGDGDGDPTTTGDGDGDPATAGDGDGDPTATGDGDGDPTTGGEMCGAGFLCIPEPGAAWDGPFVLGDSCGAPYPMTLEPVFANLDPGEPTCTCECGEPEVTCSTNMSAIGYGQNNCVGPQGSHSLDENECYNTFSASHAVSLAAASASCDEGTVLSEIPEPSFGVELSTCAGFEVGPGACPAAALCVPNPVGFDGGLCYSSAGDVGCPAGYPNKELYFSSYEDTRDCGDSCSCTASGATCSVTVTGYAQDNCGAPQGAVSTDSDDDVCAAINQNVQSIRPGNVSVKDAGMCSFGVIEASGELAPTGQLTVCCSG